MVSSPVQNLSHFLKNKPPLVVFIICLVALAVSTFYFAFEIEKDGPIVDVDKKHDWKTMLKHFNRLETCINYSTWTDEIIIREIEEQFKNELSISTKVTIEDANYLKPFSHVYGALSLQGWYSTTCQDQEKQLANVTIYFDVPSVKSLNGSLDICVTIKGPAEFLPSFKEPGCKPVSSKDKKSKDIKGILYSKLQKLADSKFCADRKLAKLQFDLEQSDILNFISDDVRTEIYIHLMWCSYFLVFLIFCLLFYAILKKPENMEKKEHSERLLYL